jgi:glutamate 5-kinase
MSSSIASLEPLSQSASFNDATPTANSEADTDLQAESVIRASTGLECEQEGWEVVEVGRGLANYNWAEVKKVKGLKR